MFYTSYRYVDILKEKKTSLEKKLVNIHLNKFNITISFLRSCKYLDIYLIEEAS